MKGNMFEDMRDGIDRNRKNLIYYLISIFGANAKNNTNLIAVFF